jgi:glycerate-2-kinase
VSPDGEVRRELEAIFRGALDAVDGGARVREAVTLEAGVLRVAGSPVPCDAPLVVLAVGKAAAGMAAALEAVAGARIAGGLVVTAPGHGAALRHLALREAAHPVPDARSQVAAVEALDLVASAPAEAVLLVLLSGGASSLLAGPAPGLSLDDLARTTAVLLGAGCDIEEQNAVRKHLSAVSGGRLGRAARSRRIEVLAVSDVPGDRLDVIGSGPFEPDPTTYADALAAVTRRALRAELPGRVIEHLEAGVRGEREETPKPGDPALARVRTRLLATNRTAIDAACAAARARGLEATCLTSALAGEARRAGRRIAAVARAAVGARAAGGRRGRCLVAGGETVVTVRGGGRGGRSQELALAAALELDGLPRVALLAAGTDGRDGPTDAAGAHADGGTAARGRALGLDPAAALEDNDSHGFFAAEGGLFRIGPTGTNVMDLVLLRI